MTDTWEVESDGPALNAKIDAARDAWRDENISKAAMSPFRVVGDV